MPTSGAGDVVNGNIGRVVAVGASNLTRGFQTIVATARHLWGPDVEVLVALGHGRSYGGPSTLVVRTIPGILECGLWRALGSRAAVPTRALVTDVGNDIMYGHPPARILQWVDDCVARLRQFTPDVVVTGLPYAATTGLPAARYVLLRSVFFPRCRLRLDDILRLGREVDCGLEAIAANRGATFRRLKPEWYGLDPIHVRPRMWRAAWQEILCGSEPPTTGPPPSWAEAVRLYAMPPERVSYFGLERRRRQQGVALRRGGRVWVY